MSPTQQPIGALFDLVFGSVNVPGGGPRWITLPPWSWFCHYCDTTASGGFAIADLDRTRLGRRRIVCQPCEWWHDFQDVGLNVDDQRRLEAAARHHLNGPGAAATWDVAQQKLQIVRARQIDWRKA